MKFLDIIEERRSHYSLTDTSPISDEQLKELLERSLKHAPSAFNSQSSRIVLLKGQEHQALWEIAMAELRKIVPAEAFAATEDKINSFAAAYGTLLFFEEQQIVTALQEKLPTYKDRFPQWSEHHAGLLQFIVWTALAEAGLGASLQHYNPLIDEAVKAKWALPESWKLIGQMPFGKSTAAPGPKEFADLSERLRIFS